MSLLRGQEGERNAQAYLENKGYTIIAKNWRFKRAEIDLIAVIGDEVVFVEVKRRANNAFGFPEEYVTRAKAQHLRRAIEGFLALQGGSVHRGLRIDMRQPRVDVIAITDAPFELVHYENIELPL